MEIRFSRKSPRGSSEWESINLRAGLGPQNHCNCRQPGPGPSRLCQRQQRAAARQAAKESSANEQESVAEEDNAAEDVAAVIEVIIESKSKSFLM